MPTRSETRPKTAVATASISAYRLIAQALTPVLTSRSRASTGNAIAADELPIPASPNSRPTRVDTRTADAAGGGREGGPDEGEDCALDVACPTACACRAFPRGHAPPQRSTDPLVSGRVRVATNAMTAPTDDVPEEPAAVPGVAEPLDHQRSGAPEDGDGEVVPGADTEPAQLGREQLAHDRRRDGGEHRVQTQPEAEHQQHAAEAGPGTISLDIGTISSAIAPDQTSICGLRPNLSAVQPKGYCRTTNSAVAIDSAQNTMPSSRPSAA